MKILYRLFEWGTVRWFQVLWMDNRFPRGYSSSSFRCTNGMSVKSCDFPEIDHNNIFLQGEDASGDFKVVEVRSTVTDRDIHSAIQEWAEGSPYWNNEEAADLHRSILWCPDDIDTQGSNLPLNLAVHKGRITLPGIDLETFKLNSKIFLYIREINDFWVPHLPSFRGLTQATGGRSPGLENVNTFGVMSGIGSLCNLLDGIRSRYQDMPSARKVPGKILGREDIDLSRFRIFSA